MIQKFIRTAFPVVLSSFFVVSCGGSSSSTDNNVANVAPILSLSNVTVNEKGMVNIPANATDSDGSINSYAWSQTSGEAITITDSASGILSFTAPSVTEAETLTFSLSVTDNDGAVTSATMDVTIDPIIVASFTVSGVVNSANAMANANVVANIGDMEFSTQTNEIGQYTVTINVDDDYQEQVLTIAATGSTANSVKKLVSVVGDIPTIRQLAEQYNNALTKAELPNLLVSNVSTAVAALMVQANNNEAITTPEQLSNSSADFNTDILMPYAAMIGYLFDNIVDVPSEILPANFVDTYQAFLNKEAATQFYYAINNYDESLFEQLKNTVFEQQNIFVLPLAFSEETAFNLDIGRLVLKPDHTGILYSSKPESGVLYINEAPSYIGEKLLTWENTQKGIHFTFNKPIFTQQNNFYTEQYSWIDLNEYLSGYSISWLYSGKITDTVLLNPINKFTKVEDDTPVIYNSYDNTQTPHNVISKVFKTLGADNSLTNFFKLDNDYVFKMKRPSFTQFQDSKNQATSINGITRISIDSANTAILNTTLFNIADSFTYNTQNAQWNVNDKNQIIVNSDNLALELFSSSVAKNNNYRDVITVATQTIDNEVKKIATVGSVYQIDKSLNWTNDNVVGIYSYNFSVRDLNPNDVNWYELRADGTLSSFWIRNPEKGEIQVDDIYESPGLWKIIDNQLVIKRYRHNRSVTGDTEPCYSSVWEPSVDDGCIVYMEKEWSAVQSDFMGNINHHITVQKFKYYSDPWRSSSDNPTGHIIIAADEYITDFIKTDERPVTLPNDYMLIKDRPSSNSSSVNSATKKSPLTIQNEIKQELLH